MNDFYNFLEGQNLTIKDVEELFNIPYRTVQNWKNGTVLIKPYILNLIQYKFIKFVYPFCLNNSSYLQNCIKNKDFVISNKHFITIKMNISYLTSDEISIFRSSYFLRFLKINYNIDILNINIINGSNGLDTVFFNIKI